MGLIMSANELTRVNLQCVGKFYANADSTPMPQLKESHVLRIIDPTKAGDGYWNYENMAAQMEKRHARTSGFGARHPTASPI